MSRILTLIVDHLLLVACFYNTQKLPSFTSRLTSYVQDALRNQSKYPTSKVFVNGEVVLLLSLYGFLIDWTLLFIALYTTRLCSTKEELALCTADKADAKRKASDLSTALRAAEKRMRSCESEMGSMHRRWEQVKAERGGIVG